MTEKEKEEPELPDYMFDDLYDVKRCLLQYVNIIIKEYPGCDIEPLTQMLNEGTPIVEFNESKTVSFFVKNNRLLLPKAAYDIIPKLQKQAANGEKGKYQRKKEEYLETNTTYFDYIKHIIEDGLTVTDYFLESLLHETMHMCGSGGGDPLAEGINELKTRELAQKYNIKIAAYGYSKEVEVAKRLQAIIGKELMDDLTFVPVDERVSYLTVRPGAEVAELYVNIANKMKEKSKAYYHNLEGISDPYEKAKVYETIDYGEVFQILEDYSKKKEFN